MDADYARDRKVRPELAFRLRCRSRVVVRAWQRYGRSGHPHVLDIGAAEGASLLEIARGIGGGEYIGLEMSRELIDAATGLPGNVRIVPGDACDLPGEFDSQFDLVSMLAVLEHVPHPLVALTGARSALRPGGLLVLTCPDPFWDSLAGRLGLVKKEHHLQELDVHRLQNCCRMAGFEVVEASRFMWAPVAVLTYGGIPVPPHWALGVDTIVGQLPMVRRLCVNACIVARNPD